MTSTGSPTYDALLDRLHRRPFEPFVVEKADGQRFVITRQFQLATNGRVVVVAPNEGDGCKSFSIVDVSAVADVKSSAA